MASKRFKDLIRKAREGDDYWIADAQIEFTEGLHDLMERRKISKSELARKIDSSPAYVTKILRGTSNFTLASMVRLVRALNGRLHIRVCAQEDRTQWVHDMYRPRPIRPTMPKQRFEEVDVSYNDNQFEQANSDEALTTAA
jgi:transcriptional regulator with XRE-family HTH domain